MILALYITYSTCNFETHYPLEQSSSNQREIEQNAMVTKCLVHIVVTSGLTLIYSLRTIYFIQCGLECVAECEAQCNDTVQGCDIECGNECKQPCGQMLFGLIGSGILPFIIPVVSPILYLITEGKTTKLLNSIWWLTGGPGRDRRVVQEVSHPMIPQREAKPQHRETDLWLRRPIPR